MYSRKTVQKLVDIEIDFVTCDNCGKEAEYIKCNKPAGSIKAKWQVVETFPESEPKFTYHLCEECVKSSFKFKEKT